VHDCFDNSIYVQLAIPINQLVFSAFAVLTPNAGFAWNLSLDGISFWLLFLTVILFHTVIIFATSIATIPIDDLRSHLSLLYATVFLILNIFLVDDIVIFYVFFESLLIPMFLLIGIFGSRRRSIHAAFLFLPHTLAGSFLFLVGILYVVAKVGSGNFAEIAQHSFSAREEYFLFLVFFSGLAVKIPLMPFHTWLPEAHVEAPTVGSVLLAGVILKIGGYGVLRFVVTMVPNACFFFHNCVFAMCILGMMYGALTALSQTDIKKIIAYSSIVHMSFATLALFAPDEVESLLFALFAMLAHGFVSAGLFFSVGMLYERYHSRDLGFYQRFGIAHTQSMPIFASAFFLLILANMSFPGTISFWGEIGITIMLFAGNPLAALMVTLPLLLSSAYNIWLATRLIHGPADARNSLLARSDLQSSEILILAFLIFFIFIFGLQPSLFLLVSEPTVTLISLHCHHKLL